MDLKNKRLDNFLCCCRLETGGHVYGWFGIIHCILAILLFIVVIVAMANNMVTDDLLQSMGFGDSRSTAQDMTNIRQTVLIVSVLAIIVCLVYFVISVVLLLGMRKKNQKHILPAVCFFGVASICTVVELYNFSIPALFNVAYHIYGFMTTYSIWRLFQEEPEKLSGTNSFENPSFMGQMPMTTVA